MYPGQDKKRSAGMSVPLGAVVLGEAAHGVAGWRQRAVDWSASGARGGERAGLGE